jgi:hypothetical protein
MCAAGVGRTDGTFGPTGSGPGAARRRQAGVDTRVVSTQPGIHCAEELVHLGVSTELAIRALMAELDLSRVEAVEALDLASATHTHR